MKLNLILIFTLLLSSLKAQKTSDLFISYDIDNFWKAFDKINSTSDSALQYKYLDELFLKKGSPGLHSIMHARNYTATSYINAIHSYPEFWKSIRSNTMRSGEFIKSMEIEIEKLRMLYPSLSPAKVYFTIGALRTNGTVYEGKILIGSELAMTDKNTVTTEFDEPFASARRKFFDSEPINDIVLLNVHEYLHTQQKEMVHNLLSQCIYEGVAEFVAILATGKKSAVPAIEFGKSHHKEVFNEFEKDIFIPAATNKWLWSDAKNTFDVRDLGYYIGYAFCEAYYGKASDKKAAISKLIELDYQNEEEIENFVDASGLLSQPLNTLYDAFEQKRPTIVSIDELKNGTKNVDPNIKELTLRFSVPMDKDFRGFDYGPLGENNVLSVRSFKGFSEDGLTAKIEIELHPGKQYQVLVTNRFCDINGYPLKPFLIDIQTTSN